MSNYGATLAALVGLLLFTGCGGKGGGGGGDAPPPPAPPPVVIPPPELDGGLDVNANGGGATGTTAAVGGRGMSLTVESDGNILIGVSAPPLPPAIPSAPPTGTQVSNWTNAQTIATGDAFINGTVTASTTGSEATLTVTDGDLVINGNLLSDDNGAVETNLVLNVPAGTVWILGSIRTGRVDGTESGDSGGSVRISALRIYFTGSIYTRGEDGTGTGDCDGGSIIFDTFGTGQTGQILVGGSLEFSGGSDSGANARGGDGGSFRTYYPSPGASGGSIHISGTAFTGNGGAAMGTGDVRGGDAGTLDLQGNGGVFLNAFVTAAGGNASSTSGDAEGGKGGALIANTIAISDSGPVFIYGLVVISGGTADSPSGTPLGGAGGIVDLESGSDIYLGVGALSFRGANSSGRGGAGGDAVFDCWDDIYFAGTLDISDGSGPLAAGTGAAGAIKFETDLGDIMISGALASNGGNGSSGSDISGGPTDGGTVEAKTGSGGGSITLQGSIHVNGGSDNDQADDNNGGSGGIVRFTCVHPSGSIYLDPGSSIQADGGQAGGTSSAPAGGDGGLIELKTGGGCITLGLVGGNINLRGAMTARGGAGIPAGGSPAGHGGTVTANTDSSTSPSGGMDGRGGSITLHAGAAIDVSGGDLTDHESVTFEADGNDSNNSSENGIVANLGVIYANSSSPGAKGGNIRFDGLNHQSQNPGPAPGSIDMQGSGGFGTWASQ